MRLDEDKLVKTFQNVAVAFHEREKRCKVGCCRMSYYQICQGVNELTGWPLTEIWDRCLDLDYDCVVFTPQFAWRN